jgi:hypothetical protein
VNDRVTTHLSAGTRAWSWTVGNGNDFAAEAPGHILSAMGSIDSVTGVTTRATGVPTPSLSSSNSNRFTTSACKGAPNCHGWQQFVFSNSSYVFMQCWLIGYGPTRPTAAPDLVITEHVRRGAVELAGGNPIDMAPRSARLAPIVGGLS